MKYSASLDRDANYQIVPGGLPFLERKTVAFTGAAGLGATGATTRFTVTGDVVVGIFATCTEDLVGDTATLEVGISGNTAALIAQTTATNIDSGESWFDSSPATVEAMPDLVNHGSVIVNGADIIETVGTANITDGTLNYYCFWRPLSSDGSVVATT